MADPLSREVRSLAMARVRSRDTRPELYVRRKVWPEGFRYRLHVRKLPGTPDLVLRKYRLAVFVNGCFWHQHGCSKSKRPTSNRDFWDQKLDENVVRDERDRCRLEALGWTVKTIWECSLVTDTQSLLASLKRARLSSSEEELLPTVGESATSRPHEVTRP